MRLTEISVRHFPAPATGWKIHADDSLPGFGVRVTANGVKAFVLTFGPARERITIGRYPIIGLADARSEARRILAEQTLGKHRPKRITFLDAMEQFIATRKEKNRPKTAYETERLLRFYFKKLHPKLIEDIAAHDFADITDALSRKGLQSTAAHAHTAAKTFMKWCAQRHYVSTSPISELEKPPLPKSRERILTDDELRSVWKAAVEMGGHFGRIVQLLIVTGQRKGEITALKLEWIKEKAITLPAEICKNNRSHRFPIGDLTSSLVEEISFNGFSKAKAKLDEKALAHFEDLKPWTLHDLRRTYATNLQRLGVKLEVIEALLNHTSGTRAGVVGTYQRHDFWDEMVAAVATFEEWFARTITQA
jgi:integrase